MEPRPSYVRKFGSSVQLAMWGRPTNYSAVTGDFISGVLAAESYFKAPVNVLNVGIKNSRVVHFGDLRPPDNHVVVGERGSIRVQRIADVGYMPIDPANPQPVVMARLNADCPAIFAVEHDEQGRDIGCWFAQASLSNLLPNKINNTQSVVATICYQRWMLGLRGSIDFYFGGGIGPCCYGFENFYPIQRRLTNRYFAKMNDLRFYSIAKLGPRTGEMSVALSDVFEAELWRTFTPESHVSTQRDVRCTACLGTSRDHGNRLLWSHVYDGGRNKTPLKPRNFMCFAWTPPRKRR